MSQSIADSVTHAGSPPTPAGQADVVAALCVLLRQGDEADRCYACRALGVLRDPASLEPLIERLHDEDVDVCVDAAEALGRLGSGLATEALLATLRGDPDGEVKTAAVEALRHLKAEGAVPALLEVAASRPEEMVFEDMEGWDAWWDIQLKAVQALGDMGVADAVPVLANILDDEDSQDIESEVLSALARAGEAGEAMLVQRLRAGDARARRRVVRALVHAGTGSARRAMGRALKDPAPEVRAAALESLARCGARRYLGAILVLCRDADAEVRGAALAAVAVLSEGGEEPIPVDEVAALMSDPSPVVRRSALAALRTASALDPEMLTRVRAAATGAEDEVANEACAVLGAHGDRAARSVLLDTLTDEARGAETRRAAALALAAIGAWDDEVAAALAGAACGPVPALRLAALTALVELVGSLPEVPADEAGVPEPLGVVLGILRGERSIQPAAGEEDGEVAEPPEAATRSVDVAAPGAEPAPLELPEAPRGSVSTLDTIAMDNAEIALGLHEQASPDAAGEAAASGQGDDGDDEPMDEYLALVRRNEEVAERLFGREGVDASEDARRLAAQVLGALDAPEAGAALSAALADPGSAVQRAAAAALASRAERGCTEGLAAPAVHQLIRLLDADDRELRRSAVHALGMLGDARAVEPLLGRLEDAYTAVRIHAVGALAALSLRNGEPTPAVIVERLLEELASPETEVRKAAGRALARLADRLPDARALVQALLDAGFRGTGEQARDMARFMRQVSDRVAGAAVLARLDALGTSAERRFAIEMLEEIFRPDPPAA